jgi:hypothetical protein
MKGKAISTITMALTVTVLIAVASAFAVPPMINYQGALTDSGGAVVNGSVSMTFAIYNSPSNGTTLWSETQDVAVVNGVFNVALGINNSLTMSVFDNPPIYLGVSVSADPEMTPRIMLLSVPYAMRAGAADDAASLGSTPAASFANAAHDHDSDYVNKGGDTMTGGLAATTSASSGSAGAFSISNPSNADNALSGSTDGGGYAVIGYTTGSNSAGAFSISNPASPASAIFGATNGSGNAVHGYATGTGTAGTFSIANPSSPAYAVLATSDGSGDAVRGYTSGTGSAGSFSVDNPASGASALYASTNGTGKAGEFAGDVSATGNVAAATFTGNGSGLSGVDASTLGGSPASAFANSVAGQSCPEGQALSGFDSAGGIVCSVP